TAQQSTAILVNLGWNDAPQKLIARNEHRLAHRQWSEDLFPAVAVQRYSRYGLHDNAQENVSQIIIDAAGAGRIQTVNCKNCLQYFVTRSVFSRNRLPAGKAGSMREQMMDGYLVLWRLPQLREEIASLVLQREFLSLHQLHDCRGRRHNLGQRRN